MKNRFFALLLSALLVVSLVVTPAVAAGFSDVSGHWAEKSIDRWSGEDILSGYGDGRFLPDGEISRAELATVLNRIMKYATLSGAAFPDVEPGAWYTDAILGANAAGVMMGDGVGMRPNDKITRQEAFVMLARALGVEADSSAVSVFSDAGSVADWAKGLVGGMTKAGFIQGAGGKISPNAKLTRAQAVTVLNNAVSALYGKAGTYSADAEKDVIVNAPNVVLKDMTVKGDLIIAEGVGNGDVSLDGVKVLGRLIVRGGGENSIVIKGASSIASVSVSRIDGKVRLSVEGGANVEVITVADGSDSVKIEGTVGTVVVENSAAPVEITGTVKKLEVAEKAAAAEVKIAATAKVESVTVSAPGTKLDVSGVVSKVEVTETAAAADITGSGKVENVTANANDVKVSTPGTSVAAGEGTSGVTAGDKPVAGGTTEETKPAEPTPPPVVVPTYYTVTFDLNGGTAVSDISSQSIVAEGKATDPGAPTKTNCAFGGWYNGNERWNFNSGTVTGNLTLTAKFIDAVTVTDADALELAISGSSPAILIGADFTLTKNISITRTVLIDGNGKTLTTGTFNIQIDTANITAEIRNWSITSNNIATYFIRNNSNAELFISDCSLKATGTSSSRGVGLLEDGGSLVLENTDIDVKYYAVCICDINQKLSINGGNLIAWAAIMTTAGGSADPVPNPQSTSWNGTIDVKNAVLTGRSISNEGYGTLIIQENTRGFTVNLENSTINTYQVNAPLSGQLQAAIVVRSFGNTFDIKNCNISDLLGYNSAGGGAIVCRYNYYAVKEYNGESPLEQNSFNIVGGQINNLSGQKPFILRTGDNVTLNNVSVNGSVTSALTETDYVLIPDAYADLERGNRSSNNVSTKTVSDPFTLAIDLCLGGKIGKGSNPTINIGADITVPTGSELEIDPGITITGAEHIKGTGTIVIHDEASLNAALTSNIANIKLGSNITLTAPIEISRDLTIDGNGKTITSNCTVEQKVGLISILGEGTKVSIQDFTLVDANGKKNTGIRLGGTANELSMTGCTMDLAYYAIMVGDKDSAQNHDDCKINLTSCRLTGYAAVYFRTNALENTGLTINNPALAVISSELVGRGYEGISNGFGTVVFNGTRNASANITGSTLSNSYNSNNYDANEGVISFNCYGAYEKNAVVTITDSVIKTNSNASAPNVIKYTCLENLDVGNKVVVDNLTFTRGESNADLIRVMRNGNELVATGVDLAAVLATKVYKDGWPEKYPDNFEMVVKFGDRVSVPANATVSTATVIPAGVTVIINAALTGNGTITGTDGAVLIIGDSGSYDDLPAGTYNWVDGSWAAAQ